MAGKLNGHIPAVTPRGSLYDTISISLEIFWSDSPCKRVPAAQLCSTTSVMGKRTTNYYAILVIQNLRIPLITSPSASANVFPCSKVMFSAIFFMSLLITAWNFIISCCLVKTDVLLQVSYAFRQDSTACSISDGVLSGTLVTKLLVAGSLRSTHWLALDSTNCPSMKSFVVGATLE